MSTTPRQLQALADDLRQLVYKLAKVEENEHQTWMSSPAVCLTGIATRSPEQIRADACLLVVQAVMDMQPGDKLSIGCTDHAVYSLRWEQRVERHDGEG